MKLIKRAACSDTAIYDTHPFLVKDVLFSAILVAANEGLLQIAQVIEAPDRDRDIVAGWIERGRGGLEACWDPHRQLCLDYNLRTGKLVQARTVAGFAPLISGGSSRERLEKLHQTFDSLDFTGNPKLRWPLPTSTGFSESSFDSRSYWRGPVWPVVDWLLWWSLVRAGELERATQLRRASLDQIIQGGFAEYFEPSSGAPLGSIEQSWTAAVALDWLVARNLQPVTMDAA